MTRAAAPPSRAAAIDLEVMRWPGMSRHPHRFGGTEYRWGSREIGHVHEDALVDVPLPRRLRDALVAGGLARPHHILPDSGWVSVPLKTEGDVANAISVLRQSYDVAWEQVRKRGGSI